MEEFEYTVTLKVTVEAYNQIDGMEAIYDVFGLGEQYGVTVKEITID